ncbi:hypothetical protein E05_47640 [Plautia stali symbiont]|nr:hypothetical protein E05_05740 [Plautia stali symbiont]BAN95452.1 hypothetical protein E05_06860 [Plautia stali symbiont]BAN96598.1 hypothetical protein E05_18320 [Plautia stali symbiont]BAN99242.1 hypothetical protein E05_44760 [Plautia stali symbiont]BAN99530.1 hypothetical protein E05_47640 [Plautia stali symbiont]
MAKKKAATSLSVTTADNITIAGGQLHTLKKGRKQRPTGGDGAFRRWLTL